MVDLTSTASHTTSPANCLTSRREAANQRGHLSDNVLNIYPEHRAQSTEYRAQSTEHRALHQEVHQEISFPDEADNNEGKHVSVRVLKLLHFIFSSYISFTVTVHNTLEGGL